MQTTRTTRSVRGTRTAVTVAAAVAAALLTVGGTAAADTATPQAAPSKTAKAPTGDGARALCKRLPKTEARIDRALRRLNGPATVRGSVARLQRRVDNAAAKGHTAVETYLKDKLTFRTSLVPTLNRRSADLATVRTWCGTQAAGGAKAAK
ncbi:hypothetical protein [Streptomyces sp. NBC_01190]|uniref:hypothetical protein n=1 Tax=Streptomyces sp. NBC_01190 TaxID=2903767 RepID=UPI00386B4285|nr:hypothetical protein OG519_32730 [Streptomyces sp. NBC_01190]